MGEPFFVDVNNLNIKKELNFEDTNIKMKPSQKNEDKNITDCEVNEFPIKRIKEEAIEDINTIQKERNYKDVAIKDKELNFIEYDVKKTFTNNSDVLASNKQCDIKRKIEDFLEVKMEVEDEVNTEEDAFTYFPSKEESLLKSLPNESKKTSLEDNLDADNITFKQPIFKSEQASMNKNYRKQHINSYISTEGSISAIQSHESVCKFKHQGSAESLDVNVAPVSDGKNSYTCSECNFNTFENKQMKNPIDEHKMKSFKCIKTNKVVPTSKTNKKCYKCDFCDYSALQKSSVNIHLRTHTGEKPFRCHYCDYTSSLKSNLKNHIRTHTREKPFKCTICDYTASHKASLKIHTRSHTGEKPYMCNVCDYTASDKSNLKDHIRTHTKEKPFKCSLCDYSASRKSHIKSHFRTHEKKMEIV